MCDKTRLEVCMVSSITFCGGGETAGSVSDRQIETAKQETTGGVGARKNQDSVFIADNDLKQDTVCFRGQDNNRKKSSTGWFAATIVADAAILVGLLGLAHKYDVVSKIKHDKVKEFFRHTDAVTKPCHEACSWVRKNCYDKVLAFVKRGK